MLLHGVPGVGKTSTAGEIEKSSHKTSHLPRPECIAESEGKPLLQITCGKRPLWYSDKCTAEKILGDLGLTAEIVEKALKEKFHLASVWNCVLLLDEADGFLACRTKNDIQRNALVSGKY